MIHDQTIVSARAEKRALGKRLVWRILKASIAALLTMPSLAAWGMEMDGPRTKQTSGNAFEQIRLPPIPHLDSMPWMKWNAGANSWKIDTLFAPTFDPSGFKLTPERRHQETATTS